MCVWRRARKKEIIMFKKIYGLFTHLIHVPRFNLWIGKNPLEKGIATILVFLPAESQGQRSLVGYSPWALKELDMIEQLTL